MDISYLIKQKSYEKVDMVLRRHIFTFIPIVVLIIVLFILPFVIYLMTDYMFPNFFSSESIFTLSILVVSTYTLSIFLFLFAQFIDFYLDIWIVTNDRIIDVEQFGLFSRTISELELYKIQDVTANIKGIFATFLDYGDVMVKTASGNQSIVFRKVPRPNAVRRRVLELVQVDRMHHLSAK